VPSEEGMRCMTGAGTGGVMWAAAERSIEMPGVMKLGS